VGDEDHVVSLEFSKPLGGCDPSQSAEISACPCLPTISGELVRCHIDLDDFDSFRPIIVDLLRSELEPFIIGVGRVIVDQADKDLVVRLSDPKRKDSILHVASSIA
jgi:hypothetical protein